MRLLALVFACLALVACSQNPTQDQATEPDGLTTSLAGKKLMFVGAHPDDEWVLMPILAEACNFNGASCHFLTVTRAEWGCFETLGTTDLDACADQRAAEFKASAAIANGTTESLDWQDLFYAHSGDGLRRNLQRWAEVEGGREALVSQLVDSLTRTKPDVVFGLDPRHGATCNPNHRAASLLLIEALAQLPDTDQPRVLFENTFAVFERMTPEMLERADQGAMYPWPDRQDPNLYYDASRTLPNGRRAIDYQIDSLRAHASQFPGLPEDLEATAEPAQLRIPVIALDDIDPGLDLCTPLDLSGYKTVDVTLEFVGRQILASAEAQETVLTVRLTGQEETIVDYGAEIEAPFSRTLTFPSREVTLVVGATTPEATDAALAAYTRLVKRYTEAPE